MAYYVSAFGDGGTGSRSRRAQIAEAQGKLPATRCAQSLGISTEVLKRIADPVEWHHVGKYANAVDYYDTDAIREEIAADPLIVDRAKSAARAARTPAIYKSGGRAYISGKSKQVIAFEQRPGTESGTAYLWDGTTAARVKSYDIFGGQYCTEQEFFALKAFHSLHREDMVGVDRYSLAGRAIMWLESAVCAGVQTSLEQIKEWLRAAESDARFRVDVEGLRRWVKGSKVRRF